MSDFLLTRSDLYPDGTSVSAYPVTNWKGGEPNLRLGPVGAASSTQTMSGGQLTFTGLVDGARYVAYALVSGKHTYVRFLLSPVPSTELTGVAGGVLAGSYPEPGFAVDMATQAELDAAVAGVEGFPADTYEFAPAPSGGDDTAALQAAFDAADGGVAILVLRGGTYRVSGALLTVNASKLRVVGLGMDRTTILVTSANAAGSIIALGTQTDIHFSDFTLDAANVVNVQRGIYATGGAGRRNHYFDRVRVKNVIDPVTTTPTTWTGIRISPAIGVRIVDCEVTDCGELIRLEDSDGDAIVRGCTLTASDSATTRVTNGVRLEAASQDDRPVLVEGCTIRGIQYDQGSNGVNGHGVRGFNHRGFKVIGCDISDTHTSAVLIGAGCAGSMVVGCALYDNRNATSGRGAGVYLEIAAGEPNDGTFGTDKKRGAVVEGNHMFNNALGVHSSFSAGSLIRGNVVANSYGEGIRNDSEFVLIEGNLVMNSWQGGGTSSALTEEGGIACHGQPAVIRGNVCIDNQTVKTQDWGIAVNDLGHVLEGNVCVGNGEGQIFQASSGSTNHNIGNVVRDDGSGRQQMIASASLLTPADDADFLLVTGTTQINNIPDSWQGRLLVLKFDGALTVTHNATQINLRGAQNFTTRAGDTLTLIHDGSNWYEVARQQAANPMETIASVATLAPAPATEFILVTGTTTVNDISGNRAGRRLTLKLDSASAGLQVTHTAAGINLAAAANFAMTANDTLSLISDGVDWYETSRTMI